MPATCYEGAYRCQAHVATHGVNLIYHMRFVKNECFDEAGGVSLDENVYFKNRSIPGSSFNSIKHIVISHDGCNILIICGKRCSLNDGR